MMYLIFYEIVYTVRTNTKIYFLSNISTNLIQLLSANLLYISPSFVHLQGGKFKLSCCVSTNLQELCS